MTSKLNPRLLAIVSATAIALAGGARATDVMFDITVNGFSATFTVPKSPTTDISGYDEGADFSLFPVTVTAYGVTYSAQRVLFINSGSGGGAFAGGGGVVSAFGSQYYSGNESAPTFIPGTYTGQFGSVAGAAPGPATVTITDVASGVPEPATWTLMLAGFGSLGGALRARRRRVTAA
jgi:hypothetical protein